MLTRGISISFVYSFVFLYSILRTEITRWWLKIRTVKQQSESPWFNDYIRAARKTRRQLERKWRDNGKREVHRQEYRKQHDIVKNMINQAKIAHYSSLVEESSGNQKKTL